MNGILHKGVEMRRRGTFLIVLLMLLLLVPVAAQAKDRPATQDQPTQVVYEVTVQRLGGSETVSVSQTTSYTAGGQVDFSVDLNALTKLATAQIVGGPPTTNATVCFGATPTWSLVGPTGMQNKAWYTINWCANAGVVKTVSNFACYGSAASGWKYSSCSKWTTTGTGYVGYGIGGVWNYTWGIPPWAIYRSITVSATHYTNGYYQGTWKAN